MHAELGLRVHADADPHDSRYHGAVLPDGWYVVVVRGDRFIDPGLLARLSRGCEAVACFVEEHVMVSHASGWADDALQVAGDPPAQLGPIRGDLEAKQRAAGNDDVDFLFDAPADLMKQLVGYHHFADEAVVSFEALEQRSAPGFWTRLLGR